MNAPELSIRAFPEVRHIAACGQGDALTSRECCGAIGRAKRLIGSRPACSARSFPAAGLPSRRVAAAFEHHPQHGGPGQIGERARSLKLEYLRSHKRGSIELAGLEGITTEQLSALIAAKLESNYIHNLKYLEEHDASLFNLLLELPNDLREDPVRLMASLRYMPRDGILKLVTMF